MFKSRTTHIKSSTPKVVFKSKKKHIKTRKRKEKQTNKKLLDRRKRKMSQEQMHKVATIQVQENDDSDNSLVKSSPKQLNRKLIGGSTCTIGASSSNSQTSEDWEKIASENINDAGTIGETTNKQNWIRKECSILLHRLKDSVNNKSTHIEEQNGSYAVDPDEKDHKGNKITNINKEEKNNSTIIIVKNQQECLHSGPVVSKNNSSSNTLVGNGERSKSSGVNVFCGPTNKSNQISLCKEGVTKMPVKKQEENIIKTHVFNQTVYNDYKMSKYQSNKPIEGNAIIGDKDTNKSIIRIPVVHQNVTKNKIISRHQNDITIIGNSPIKMDKGHARNFKQITIPNNLIGLGNSAKRKLTKVDILHSKKVKLHNNENYSNTAMLPNGRLTSENNNNEEQTQKSVIKGYNVVIPVSNTSFIEYKNTVKHTVSVINDAKEKKTLYTNKNSNKESMFYSSHQLMYDVKASDNYQPFKEDHEFLKPSITFSERKTEGLQESTVNDEDDCQSLISLCVNPELQKELEGELESEPEIGRNRSLLNNKRTFGNKSVYKMASLHTKRLETKTKVYRNSTKNDINKWVANQNEVNFPSTSLRQQELCQDTIHFNEKKEIESPFSMFCIDYLRNSILKGRYHHCNSKHEVPCLENSRTSWTVRELTNAIETIIETEFIDPPEMFLREIIKFCVSNQISILKKIALNFITGRTYEDENKLREFLTLFISCITSTLKSVKDCSETINTIFEYIFGKIDIRSKKYVQVLDLLLNVLGQETKMHKDLPLLQCVEFLKKNETYTNYPINFKKAVVKQLMERNPNNPSTRKFTYRVYKTFFTKMNDDDIYKSCEQSTDLAKTFFDFSKKNGIIFSERTNDWEKVNRNVSHFNSPEHLSSRFNSNFPRDDSYNIENKSNASINHLIDTAIKHPETEIYFNMLVNTLEKSDFNPVTIFNQLHENGNKGRRCFMQILHNCSDFLKKALNNITMSFIMLSSKEDDWETCHFLYRQMKDLDPHTIKDYLFEDKSPASNILLIIKACLERQQLEDAAHLYFKYGLYKDHTQWTVRGSNHDLATRSSIYCDFKRALSRNRQPHVVCHVLTKLIDLQLSLRGPIDLTECIVDYVRDMVTDNWFAENYKLVTAVLQAIIRNDLIAHMHVENPLQWRLLISAFIKLGNIFEACVLFIKSEPHVDCYFLGENKTTLLELDTCLAREEMKVIMLVLFPKLSTTTIGVPNLVIKFKVTGKDSLDQSSGVLYKTITEAKNRFKSVMGDFGLGMSSLHIKEDEDTYILDRVILIECTKQFNHNQQ